MVHVTVYSHTFLHNYRVNFENAWSNKLFNLTQLNNQVFKIQIKVLTFKCLSKVTFFAIIWKQLLAIVYWS